MSENVGKYGNCVKKIGTRGPSGVAPVKLLKYYMQNQISICGLGVGRGLAPP